VADCSHLVVFAVWRKITEAHVDQLIDSIVVARGVHHSTLAGYRRMMVGDIVRGPRSRGATDWAKLQAYIALGNFMTSAALMGIDTCPMEGFNAEKYDETLGLGEKGLTTAVLCAAGYRALTDRYGQVPKVRFQKEKVVVRI
jgi:hypothetical protein